MGIVVLLSAGIFTGCGGTNTAFYGKTDSASGGAVSGSAVSGEAVSGSAVEAEGNSEDAALYMYCNEYNLYYTDWDETLIEHNRKTGEERKIRVEGMRDVLYVDEDWVYYETYAGDESENWEKIWRAPVCKDRNWKLDEDAAELVLERELGGGGSDGEYWVDGRYIVYLETREAGEPLKIYDIQKKQYQADDPAVTNSIVYGLMGDFVIASAADDGVLLKNLISGSVKTLKKESFGEIIVDVMPDPKNQEIFIAASDENFQLESVWRYCLSEDKLEKIADTSQMKQLLQKEGVLEPCGVCKSHVIEYGGVFVREGHLYVQLDVSGGEEVICHNMVVVSKNLQTEDEWKWEKSLNDILHNPEANQKIFEKVGRQAHKSKQVYRSRGLCTDMTEEMCLLYLERAGKGRNQFASYDFKTGKLKWLTEKDQEWWVQYYGVWNEFPDPNNTYAAWTVIAALPNNFECE